MDVPPGWYASGVPGEERWWSGVEWTDFTRPIGGPKPKGIQPGGTVTGSIVGGSIAGAITLSIFGTALLAMLGNPLLGFGGFVVGLGAAALTTLAFYNAHLLTKRDRERAARTAVAQAQGPGAQPTPGQ